MSDTRWVGHVRGARIGDCYAEFDDALVGILSVGLSDSTSARFVVRNHAQDNSSRLLIPVDAAGNPDSTRASGVLLFDRRERDKLAGTWALNDGAQGVFVLSKWDHTSPDASEHSPAPASPQALWTKEIPLGAIALYSEDVERIVADIRNHIPEPRNIVISAFESGQTVILPAEEYLARHTKPSVVRRMFIIGEETDTSRVRKIIRVILTDDGTNRLVVESSDELWTAGAAVRMERGLKNYTSLSSSFLRKYGLNTNLLILFAVLFFLPDFNPAQRTLALGVALVLIIAVTAIMPRVGTTKVVLDRRRPGFVLTTQWPSIVSLLVTVVAAATASVIPALLNVVNSALWWLQQALN